MTCRDRVAGLYQVVYGVEDRVESHQQTHLTLQQSRQSRRVGFSVGDVEVEW